MPNKDPIKRKEYNKQHKLRNIERYRENNRKWRTANKERTKERDLRSHYMRYYGITLEYYNELVKFYEDKCALCKRIPKEKLEIDHCHSKGVIRGLLCKSCNRGLGALGDTIEGLERALTYLKIAETKNFPAKCKVLDKNRKDL